jgi:hypothetical protein
MAGIDEHIQTLRLFDLALENEQPLTGSEAEHLRGCGECGEELELFARQFPKPPISPERLHSTGHRRL